MSEKQQPIESIMRARVTEKVLASLEARAPLSSALEAKNRPLVESALEAAGWAPFHFARGVNGLAEPWRVHVLWNSQARRLSRFLSEALKLNSKEPQLAAACSALVLVTWLPEDAPASLGQSEEKAVIRNEEHLAAASAMVQNLLLALTAKGMGTYWSSGGKLRGAEVFAYLGIPQHERLLAAVFIEYPESKLGDQGEIQRKPGALRSQRSTDWIRIVDSACLNTSGRDREASAL